MAELSGQPSNGGRAAEPRPPLLPHHSHQRPGAARAPRMRGLTVAEPTSREEYVRRVLSLPRNSGNHRPCEPARPPAGRPTASTRRTLRSCRERSGIGGSTSPLPSCRRFPFGHGSLLGLLPPCDRGSARTQDQSGLLSLRPQQTSSLLLGLIA